VKLGDWVKLGNGVTLGNGRPLITINNPFAGNEYQQGVVRIGCETHKISYWKKHAKEIDHRNGSPGLDEYYLEFVKFVERFQKKFPLPCNET